jgi:hypothetical protein
MNTQHSPRGHYRLFVSSVCIKNLGFARLRGGYKCMLLCSLALIPVHYKYRNPTRTTLPAPWTPSKQTI